MPCATLNWAATLANAGPDRYISALRSLLGGEAQMGTWPQTREGTSPKDFGTGLRSLDRLYSPVGERLEPLLEDVIVLDDRAGLRG